MEGIPKVLILGHSFVRRLQNDLSRGFDPRTHPTFCLSGVADVFMYGIGGRTAKTLQLHDLHVVSHIMPQIVILEVGTNGLTNMPPEVVGSDIEDLIVALKTLYSVEIVVLCHVIPHGTSAPNPAMFRDRAKILKQYLSVVLEPLDGVLCWCHRAFTRPDLRFYDRFGVHLNAEGQYLLY